MLLIFFHMTLAGFWRGGSPQAPAPGRRTLLEVNHNKTITKKLVSATHYQQVIIPQ